MFQSYVLLRNESDPANPDHLQLTRAELTSSEECSLKGQPVTLRWIWMFAAYTVKDENGRQRLRQHFLVPEASKLQLTSINLFSER